MSDLLVHARGDRVRFNVRVQPRASRAGVGGIHAGALKVRLIAPPVDGAANEALLTLLAEALDIRRSAVHIIAGETSRTKLVEVEGVSVVRVRGLSGV